MRRVLTTLVTALSLLSPALPVESKPAAKKKAAASKKAPASKKSWKSSKKGAAKSASKKGSKAPSKSWRSGQRQPAPERYREIQQALAQKGYYSGEPSGVWDSGSQEALKRFQADQKLEVTGKLNSLSLIALGLGPKREPLSLPSR